MQLLKLLIEVTHLAMPINNFMFIILPKDTLAEIHTVTLFTKS